MGYDAMLTAAVARELDRALAGRRLTGLGALAGADVLLSFGPRSKPAWLVLATEPFPAAFGLEGDVPDLLERASAAVAAEKTPAFDQFVRLLEVRLAGRTLERVAHRPWERILELTLAPREGLRGDREPVLVVHEAAPKPARVVLLSAGGTVVAAWPPGRSGKPGPDGEAEPRLEAGRPYSPPKPTWGRTPSDLAASPQAFAAALAGAAGAREGSPAAVPEGEAAETGSRGPAPEPETGPAPADDAGLILRACPPLGPVLAREIARRAGDGAPSHVRDARDIRPTDTNLLFEAFRDVVSLYPDGPFDPCLLVAAGAPTGGRRPPAVEVSAVRVGPDRGRSVLPSRSAGPAILAWHLDGRGQAVASETRARLERTVRLALRRARRKVERQAEDLARKGEAAELRRLGELLLANLARIKPGEKEAVIADYEGRPVKVALDPRLTPARNAQAYFERYRKAVRTSRAGAPRRKAADELSWLEAVAYDLDAVRESGAPDGGQGETASATSREGGPEPGWTRVWAGIARTWREVAEIQAVEATLASAGYLPRRAGAARGRSRRAARPVPVAGGTGPEPAGAPEPGASLRFVTSDGLTVLAGRSARQNVALSLKLAAPGDYWLHARGCPGAHVLLKVPPENPGPPPPTSLLEAAALAAHLSAARGAAKVEVDYTQAKHLRRPKGSRPGVVLYDPHDTVLVDTRETRLPRATGVPAE